MPHACTSNGATPCRRCDTCDATANSPSIRRGPNLAARALDREAGRVRVSIRSGERVRTLLVEDDPLMRDELQRRLEALDLRVTAVSDGGGGLIAHLKAPFELLVVDWVTPDTDGLQLCRRIRATPGGDAPYILVVTGRDR